MRPALFGILFADLFSSTAALAIPVGVSLDEARRDIALLGWASTSLGSWEVLNSPTAYPLELFNGNVTISFDSVGWQFNTVGTTTKEQPFQLGGNGTWDNSNAASGSWTSFGNIGSDMISGQGTIDLDAVMNFMSTQITLGSVSQEWRTDLSGPPEIGSPQGFLDVTADAIGALAWQNNPVDPLTPVGMIIDTSISTGVNDSFTMTGLLQWGHPNGPILVEILGGDFAISGQGNSAQGFIRAAAPIPEPTTMILTGVGLASLMAMRSRRYRKVRPVVGHRC